MRSLYLHVLLSLGHIIFSPEGTYAIITKHGEFHEVRKEGGMYFCLPWVIYQFIHHI